MFSLGDQLYAFTEWLRTTSLVEASLWMSEQPLSLLIQTNFWVIPIVQTIHILSLAALFGSSIMMNLRVLGLTGGERTIVQTGQRYLPWVWGGLLTLLISGSILILGEPIRELINPVFWIKMALVLLAVFATLRFQASVRRNAATWDSGQGASRAIRAGAIGMIIFWCVIVVAGRWIAYAPV